MSAFACYQCFHMQISTAQECGNSVCCVLQITRQIQGASLCQNAETLILSIFQGVKD